MQKDRLRGRRGLRNNTVCRRGKLRLRARESGRARASCRLMPVCHDEDSTAKASKWRSRGPTVASPTGALLRPRPPAPQGVAVRGVAPKRDKVSTVRTRREVEQIMLEGLPSRCARVRQPKAGTRLIHVRESLPPAVPPQDNGGASTSALHDAGRYWINRWVSRGCTALAIHQMSRHGTSRARIGYQPLLAALFAPQRNRLVFSCPGYHKAAVYRGCGNYCLALQARKPIPRFSDLFCNGGHTTGGGPCRGRPSQRHRQRRAGLRECPFHRENVTSTSCEIAPKNVRCPLRALSSSDFEI